ncbi:hypothetical protein CEXT_458571 [Caerostris extrusa]|uniref:Uncharacterized protein n=1 Tax=Caerostris extrusa TaxID=172846 RepID=A0AAV4VRX6_CAEEX|nr:hypothetical protein CEXT_458571 [Caerostris extrusa]
MFLPRYLEKCYSLSLSVGVSAQSVFFSNFFTTPCGKFIIFHLHLHPFRRVTVLQSTERRRLPFDKGVSRGFRGNGCCTKLRMDFQFSALPVNYYKKNC